MYTKFKAYLNILYSKTDLGKIDIITSELIPTGKHILVNRKYTKSMAGFMYHSKPRCDFLLSLCANMYSE